ncbi:MAG: hypothetical protein ACFCU2_12895 [Acidimicrobiia bacterium]
MKADLESFYEVPVEEVAHLVRSIIAFDPIEVMSAPLLLRSLEVYETHRIDYAEAYLVASAEASEVNNIASFDRDRSVPTVTRIEPQPILTCRYQSVFELGDIA